jgi:hypothetical protein
MANRPIFVPNPGKAPLVHEIIVEFTWHPGFSKSQAQKSIASLHEAASKLGVFNILEISSKSPSPLGVALSAFNLMLTVEENRQMPVECAFQGSKVFENGGPYNDLYSVSSKEAKTDERLRNSGDLTAFNFLGEDFPTSPVTAFYDWLYITGLGQNPRLAQQLPVFQGFSDITFNPKRSINCQARSAALYVTLQEEELLESAMQDKDTFVRLLRGQEKRHSSVTDDAQQPRLL